MPLRTGSRMLESQPANRLEHRRSARTNAVPGYSQPENRSDKFTFSDHIPSRHSRVGEHSCPPATLSFASHRLTIKCSMTAGVSPFLRKLIKTTSKEGVTSSAAAKRSADCFAHPRRYARFPVLHVLRSPKGEAEPPK